MAFARIVLGVIGLGTLGFGVFAFVRPESLAEVVALTATAPEGFTELRAFYGGVEFGLAAFWIGAAFSKTLVRPALLSMFCVWALVAVARGIGVLMDDTATNFMLIALVTEALSALLAAAGLLSLRATDASPAA
ncbi:MAG: DUF4345 family protein [Pseudomonadota bacterium]